MFNTISAPPIYQNFNKYLLADFLQRSRFRLEDIVKLSNKKIRKQDIGKRKKFDILLHKYEEVYVRKKNEKEEFERKIKEKIKERSYLPTISGTYTFRRMDSGE